MDDLVAFLRARLDEDDQVAHAASPGPWEPNAEHDEVLAVDDITVADGFALSGRQLRATVDHIARWDPARVLAEVEAKRRIVDECSHELSRSAPRSNLNDFACTILRNLGEPHADHPDYREEWRP